MKLIPGLLLSSAVALGVVGDAMAQDAPARPPGQAQAGPQGPRGGPPGGALGPGQERAPPSIGGVVGTVDSVSASGFEMTTAAGRKTTVEQSSATTYRTGKAASSASAVKKGERVLAIGLVTVGRGDAGTTVKANEVVVGPGGAGAQISVVTPPGTPPVAKDVGKIPATYVQGEGTIISGPEAYKAIEAGLTAWTGGYVNRVVKLATGEYEVHNVGVSWPHHIFLDKDFKYLGAQ
ncbi:MAG TPA: hypothetical protein VL460_01890 [Caulobacteraceae bacterium]|jgi:hypothetical protein|nr:hypothetical protein [Caulobacteraceae bacterium]